MADVLAPARVGFFRRLGRPAWLGRLFASAPRSAVVAGLAGFGPLLLFLALILGPASVAIVLTDPVNVQSTFARFIGGVVTASSIAVSVAVLSLKSELKDLRGYMHGQEANDEFRRELRELLGTPTLPILLGETAAETLDTIADRAARAREGAGAGLDAEELGSTLGEYLALLEHRARVVAAEAHDARLRPDRLHMALLDFEHELTVALARRYARHAALDDATRARIAEIEQLLRRAQLLANYTKSLDTAWGLSRMSHAILLTTVPAVLIATVMTLAYTDDTVAALGRIGAGVLVCGMLALTLVPLSAFVAFLVRFVFLNQHTLGTHGFVLGPEEPAMGAKPTSGRRAGGEG